LPKKSEPVCGANFFAYGTLQLAEVMTGVTGRTFAGEAAVLEGFRRCAIRNEPYPGLREEPGGRTDGMLYRGLDVRSLAALDAFEGVQYARQQVQVQTADGRRHRAYVYVTAPIFLNCLTDEEWDLAAFREEHLDWRCSE